MSPFFLEGLRCPYFLVGLEAHAWWPSNPRLPLFPLIALRPCFWYVKYRGVMVLDGADRTQLPGRPGGPGISDERRGP